MEFWILVLIIAGPILSLLGWLFWIGIAAVIAKQGFDVAKASYGTNLFGSNNQFDALLTQIDQALRTAATRGQATGSNSVSTTQQLQLQRMLMDAQNQMKQMDSLSRQRYETRVADLTGMAASAGIDWKPPTF